MKKAEQREINEKVERAVKWYKAKISHSDNMILADSFTVIQQLQRSILQSSQEIIILITKTDTPGRR